MRRELALVAVGVVALVAPEASSIAAGAAAGAPGFEAARSDEHVDDFVREAARYWALADSLAARVAETVFDDDIVQLEIEEISFIADELAAEGDADIAVTLLEDAFALLDGGLSAPGFHADETPANPANASGARAPEPGSE